MTGSSCGQGIAPKMKRFLTSMRPLDSMAVEVERGQIVGWVEVRDPRDNYGLYRSQRGSRTSTHPTFSVSEEWTTRLTVN